MTRRVFFLTILAPYIAAFARFFPKSKVSNLKKQWTIKDENGNLLMGYKGTSVYDAGYVYCPYIPLQFVDEKTSRKFHEKYGYGTPIAAY